MAFKRRHVDAMEERLWTGLGFFATYVGTQVLLPRIAPSIATNQKVVDGVLAIGGTVVSVKDSGPLGAAAFGAALVGTIQTMDRVTNWIETKFAAAA